MTRQRDCDLRVNEYTPSGDLLPPSPPAEKATARQDQAGSHVSRDCGPRRGGALTPRTQTVSERKKSSVPRRPEKESPVGAGQVHPGRKILVVEQTTLLRRGTPARKNIQSLSKRTGLEA